MMLAIISHYLTTGVQETHKPTAPHLKVLSSWRTRNLTKTPAFLLSLDHLSIEPSENIIFMLSNVIAIKRVWLASA